MNLRSCLARFAAIFLAALGLLEAAQAQSNRYGVIVAVEDYKNTAPVAYAREDAELMRETFEKVLQIPLGNIQEYLNPTSVELDQIFGAGGEPGDIGNAILHADAEVYVYFAGHGSKELDPVSNSMRGYLLATDSNPNRLRQTAYPYEQLMDQLAALRNAKFAAGKVYLFMESCFSGRTAAGELVSGVSAAAFGGDPEPIKQLSEQRGIITVSAAAGDQTAYWDREMKNGVFTRFLADGLFGQADGVGPIGEKDGAVTFGELSAYLHTTVPRRALAMDASARQTPEIVDADPATVLVTLPQDFELTSNRLQEQRELEKRRIERELRRDVSTMSTSALSEKLQLIRDWIAACTADCDNLKRHRQKIEDVLRACRVDRGVYRDAIQASDFDWLSEEIEAGACDELKVIAKSCAASRSATSDSCKCLQEDVCITLPGTVASADAGQDNQSPTAEVGTRLEAGDQAFPVPGDGGVAPLAEPPSSPSPNTVQPTAPTSSDSPQPGTAGMLPDANRQANVRRLIGIRDHKLPAGSWRGQSGSDACQVDIRWTEQDGSPTLHVKYSVEETSGHSLDAEFTSTDSLTGLEPVSGRPDITNEEIGKFAQVGRSKTITRLSWEHSHPAETIGDLSIEVSRSIGSGPPAQARYSCAKLTPVYSCDATDDPGCGMAEILMSNEKKLAELRSLVGEGLWAGMVAERKCFVSISWRSDGGVTSATIRTFFDSERNANMEDSAGFSNFAFTSADIQKLDRSESPGSLGEIDFSLKREFPSISGKNRVWHQFGVRRLDKTLTDVTVSASRMSADANIEPELIAFCMNLKKTSNKLELRVSSGTLETPQPPEPEIDPAEAARLLQGELKRVGCYSGDVDGIWGPASSRAVSEFIRYAGGKFSTSGATEMALGAVRAEPDRVCPLSCGRGRKPEGERCIPIVCGGGSILSAEGTCIKPAKPRPRQRQAKRDERKPVAPEKPTGGNCFSFNGEQICN